MARPKAEPKLGTLRDIPTEEYVTTGVEEVDELLGGGFPRRRITQLYGNPGVGKSYLLARTMASLKGRILYCDTEYALNKQRLLDLGVDLDSVDHVADSRLEDVTNFIINHIDNYDLVIIDTLAKLTPLTIETNAVGNTSAIGLSARFIGQFEAKLRPKLYKSRAAVVGINQVRANMGFGPVQTQAFGGWAWGHAIDLNLKLFKGEQNQIIKQVDGQKQLLGHWASIKVEKSRVTAPGTTTKFKILY